jgi:ketosteroid isomerase-like protein
LNQPAQGTDAIRERYRGVLTTHPSIVVRTLSVNVAGNLAVLHGKWILLETGSDGRQLRREGRNAEIARQQPDGRWLFAIDNPAVPQD